MVGLSGRNSGFSARTGAASGEESLRDFEVEFTACAGADHDLRPAVGPSKARI
jgi:hypothetical protein